MTLYDAGIIEQWQARSTQPEIASSHGWPSDLFVVAFPDGRLACNRATTEGIERDPMKIEGLALHLTEVSAVHYISESKELPPGGKPCAMSYDAARLAAVGRDLDALLLMDGVKIIDMEFLK